MITPRIVQIQEPQACEQCRFRQAEPPPHSLAHLPGLLFVGCGRGDCDNWELPGREVAPATETDAPKTQDVPE